MDKRIKIITLTSVVILLAAGFFIFNKEAPPKQSPQAKTSEEVVEPEKKEPTVPPFEAGKLQALLDGWVASHPGVYGVVLTDKDSKIIASVNPDRQFYAASIYKLFVVYEAYLRVDKNEYDLDEIVASGQSLRTCLDIIVRLSNTNEAQSCAETLWTKQGKELQTQKLKDTYGLTNTSLVSINTSARDTAIILSRLEGARDLSASSRESFLESMKNQIHRGGLPSGIKSAIVYEKVGFNGYEEYHDAAILRFNDGRSLVVSLFTNGAGTKNIAGLASEIEKIVLE